MKLVVLLLFIISWGVHATPDWVNDVHKVKACRKRSLCAIGTGTSIKWAKIQARTALAKIFSSKISSKFSSRLSNTGEDVSEELEETTEAVLSGVTILKIHEDDSQVYALAAINKAKAARGFQTEIDKIDHKMQVLLNDNSINSVWKLEKLYQQRELLNKRYAFLRGQEIPKVVTFQQIFQKKKKLGTVIVRVSFDEMEPKELEGLLIKLLTNSGITVVKEKNKGKLPNYFINGSLSIKKEYLKVEGFKKYRFILNLSAYNPKHIVTGNLHFSTSATGRGFMDAYGKALGPIKKFLETNIDKLNIGT